MAIVVFLLLGGMLAAEIAVFGIDAAGVVGAALFVACAIVLLSRRPQEL